MRSRASAFRYALAPLALLVVACGSVHPVKPVVAAPPAPAAAEAPKSVGHNMLALAEDRLFEGALEEAMDASWAAGRLLVEAGDGDAAGHAFHIALSATVFLGASLERFCSEIQAMSKPPPLAAALAARCTKEQGQRAAMIAFARSDTLLSVLRDAPTTSLRTRGLAWLEIGNNGELSRNAGAACAAFEQALPLLAAAGATRWLGLAEGNVAWCRMQPSQTDLAGGERMLQSGIEHLATAPFVRAMIQARMGFAYDQLELDDDAHDAFTKGEKGFLKVKRFDWATRSCMHAMRILGLPLRSRNPALSLQCIEHARAIVNPAVRSQLLHDATTHGASDLDRALQMRLDSRKTATYGPGHDIMGPNPELDPAERAIVENMLAALDAIGVSDAERASLLLYLPKYDEALAWSDRELRELNRRSLHPSFALSPLEIRAKALEGLGRIREAATTYEEYAKRLDPESEKHRHQVLLHAARLYEQVAGMPAEIDPGKTLWSGKEADAVNAATRLYDAIGSGRSFSPYRLIAIQRLIRMRVWRGQSADLAVLAREYIDEWSQDANDFDPSLPTPIELLRFVLAALPKQDTAHRGALSCLLGERLVKFDHAELEREAKTAFGTCNEAARLLHDDALATRAHKGLDALRDDQEESFGDSSSAATD